MKSILTLVSYLLCWIALCYFVWELPAIEFIVVMFCAVGISEFSRMIEGDRG